MNADKYHKEGERVEILRKFLVKMANSGYGPPTRKEVLKSGIRRYFRKMFAEKTGGPKMYRTDEHLREGRKYKHLLTKRWYKPRRGGKAAKQQKKALWEQEEGRKQKRGKSVKTEKGEKAGKEERKEEGEVNGKEVKVKVVEGMIFIPYTPEFHLIEELQRVEDTLTAVMHTQGLRFVERRGDTVSRILGNNNP